MGNCFRKIMSYVISTTERFAMVMAFTCMLSCAIVCLLAMLSFGVGLGYNYSYVDYRVKHNYVRGQYKVVRPTSYTGPGFYKPTFRTPGPPTPPPLTTTSTTTTTTQRTTVTVVYTDPVYDDVKVQRVLAELDETVPVNVTNTQNDTAPPYIIRTMMHPNHLSKWLAKLQQANKSFSVHIITN